MGQFTRDLEHRGERSYDEQGVSTLVLPNGSHACATDRGLLDALLRATYRRKVARAAKAKA